MADEDITEITKMDVDIVAAVPAPASGSTWVLAKSQEAAETAAAELAAERNRSRVDEAIAKAVEAEQALVKSLEDDESLWKASDPSDKARKKMASSGVAMPDGSYPIPDVAHLKAAIRAVGRGKNNSHAAIRKHIVKRAKALGHSDLVPDSWSQSGDATKALDRPNPNKQGGSDEQTPGSPAWEADDAAGGIAVGQQIAHIRQQLQELRSREAIEVAHGEADDVEDVACLSDALYLTDQLLGIVAAFSFREEAAGRSGDDDVAKSLVTSQVASVIRQARADVEDALGKGVNVQSGAVGALDTEVLQVEITEQELQDRLTKAAEESMTKALEAKDAAWVELVKARDAELEELAAAEQGKEEDEVAKAAEAPAEPAKDEAQDAIVKALGDFSEVVKGVGDKVVALEDRLAKVESEPAPGGPVVGPQAAVFRGPEGEAQLAKMQDLEGRLAKATDPAEKADLGMALFKERYKTAVGA